MAVLYLLASGSSGNAMALLEGGVCFLVDAGISCRRIRTSLASVGVSLSDVRGIFITHTHSDHVSGLRTLLKQTDCPVLSSPGACRQLDYRFEGIRPRLAALPLCEAVPLPGLSPDTPNGRPAAGPVRETAVPPMLDTSVPLKREAASPMKREAAAVSPQVTAFPTSHDAPGSCAFRFDTPSGSLGILTDTGYVTEEARRILPGVQLAVLEANHDIQTLREGPYPWQLQERILGAEGHLSNIDAAAFAVILAEAGASELVLAHLSAENNIPSLARETVAAALSEAGYAPALSIAPRDTLSRPYFIGGAFGRAVPVYGVREQACAS